MGKDFLSWKIEQKGLYRILLVGGTLISAVLAVRAFQETKLTEDGLLKNESPWGSYEQELIAVVEDKRIPLNVTVDERTFSEEEAWEKISEAEEILPELLKGENETLSEVRWELDFVEELPGSPVEITWTEIPLNYLESAQITEFRLSAVLSCQEYAKDYSVVITVFPREKTLEETLLEMIHASWKDDPQSELLKLPQSYGEEKISWRKPMDWTWFYFFLLTAAAAVGLKLGEKRDQKEAERKRLEELEKDYAQLVSKFAMLLSAGLSVRNAWERIVLLYRRNSTEESVLYRELSWGYRELQKGTSELQVYENFAGRVGQLHYKKLMMLFIQDRRRGNIHLPDAMNEEMLQAWDEKKRRTRQQGEKIGARLLLPMMGMLGIVFVIILVPAFLSIQ